MKKQNVAQASKLEGFAQIFLFGVVVLQELANFSAESRRCWFSPTFHTTRVQTGRHYNALMNRKKNHATEAAIFEAQ